MINKGRYETPNIEIILYAIEDIVCTSMSDFVKEEVGEPWDELWDE